MIPVEERARMRHAYYIEHKTIRQIARDLRVARQTVRKAVEAPDAPPYQRSHPRPAPILGPYKARLDDLLAENERLPRKQRFTSHKMFTTLQAEGYQGSESRIRVYVGQQRHAHRRPAVFLPLEFDPGQDAQVDWGDASAIMQGEQITFQ